MGLRTAVARHPGRRRGKAISLAGLPRSTLPGSAQAAADLCTINGRSILAHGRTERIRERTVEPRRSRQYIRGRDDNGRSGVRNCCGPIQEACRISMPRHRSAAVGKHTDDRDRLPDSTRCFPDGASREFSSTRSLNVLSSLSPARASFPFSDFQQGPASLRQRPKGFHDLAHRIATGQRIKDVRPILHDDLPR